MKLGFHAAGAITNVGQYAELMTSGLGEEAYSYLAKRGVPSSIIEKAKLKGTERLEMVSAIDLFDQGVLTGLVDGEQKLDINTAKWRYVEKIFTGEAALNLSQVLVAIRETAPDYVIKYARLLYAAVISKDIEQMKILMRDITDSIINEATFAADGSVLNQYIAIQFLQLRHLAKLEQWKACIDYSNGNIGEAQSVMSRDLHKKELETQAELIRSASSKKWQKQPMPSWVKQQVNAIAEESVKEAYNSGFVDLQGKYKDEKGQCLYLLSFFERILDQDIDTAAPILRSIMTEK